MIPEPPPFKLRGSDRLLEVRLPAGDVGGFDVASRWNLGSNRRKYQPPEGYDGYRFIGAGRGKTHIRPNVGNVTSSNSTVVIGRMAGHNAIEGVTIHGASQHAIRVGEENRVVNGVRQFPHVPLSLTLRDFEIVADEPTDGKPHSSVRGLFTYNADVELEDGTIDWRYGSEHGGYHHGVSEHGITWLLVKVPHSGAEGFKCATRPEEALWVPDAWIRLIECEFADWYQSWSWQGGCGANMQGTATSVLVRGCTFKGSPGHTRGKCLMVGDGGGRFYDASRGWENVGLAEKWVIIQRNGFFSGPGGENLSVILRVGSESHPYTGPVCRGLLIEDNAVYGERMLLQLSGVVGPLVIRDNNSVSIATIASDRGFDPSHEAVIPTANRLVPISEGLVR